MKTKNKGKDISTWSEVKDQIYGEEGTGRNLRPKKALEEKLKLESALVTQESLSILKEFESI